MTIVAREREVALLERLYRSKEAEFIAVYGRRRVGKTYLIREFFSKKGTYFEATGTKQGLLVDQLQNFTDALATTFYGDMPLKAPSSWRDAFALLTQEIEKLNTKKKVTIFLDELPWLASKRSKCLENLEYFWNTKWSRMSNVTLIVCGSAASWMLKKIVNAKGGLHNRITQSILLEPFNLKQAQDYLSSRGIKLNHKQVLDIYMVMGGIPFYLKQVSKGLSATQIINQVCFKKDGLLFTEFNRLFQSLFDKADLHISIIKEIASKRYGISREALLKTLNIKSGSVINDRLEELTAAGFIQRFIPYGRKKKDHYYQVIDEYSLFYLNWIEPYALNPQNLPSKGHWQKVTTTAQWLAWSGYAFEGICHKHINQISQALDLDHTVWIASSWRLINENNGAQIDLLFDRNDDVITLGEIKFSQNVFIIDKAYAKSLLNKIDLFKQESKTMKDIRLAMLTTRGVKSNVWSRELLDNEVMLEDLFCD